VAGKTALSFAVSAVRDLEEVLSYYSEQGVPDVGERFIARVVSQIEKLSDHPDMGRVVPEFSVEHLRELIRPPFRIVYRRDKNKVQIVRVWRSERILRLP
jgi:plasmid stabilization system protein ParE